MAISVDTFREIINQRFAGKLVKGSHPPNSVACALEAYSQVLGVSWTDDPEVLRIPDLRPLNDGPWSSDAARTQAMIPLVVSLAAWDTWSRKQQNRWLQTIVIETVRQIVSALPNLSVDLVQRCQSVTTLATAGEAAQAAAWSPGAVEAAWAAEEAAWAAVEAAWAAEEAAWTAAWAAGEGEAAWAAAADRVLRQACSIWISAADAVYGSLETS